MLSNEIVTNNSATIDIRGGLGNQLFQIFTLFAFCYDNDMTPVLPSVKTCRETPPRKLYWDGFLNKMQHYVGETPNDSVLYQEPSVHYTPFPLFLCSKNVKLTGQYMSHLYFERWKERIFGEMGLASMKFQIYQKYNYIFAEPNVRRVSLHFRLGDFLDKQCYHPVMPLTYYVDAMTQLMSQSTVERWVFYVFYERAFEREINERISQLYSVFAAGTNLEIRKVPKCMTDEEELVFMSMCHDNIMANSTFSWWAAYMNDTPTQRVMYPSQMYGHQLYYLESADMFPVNWCKINVDLPQCKCYEILRMQQK